MQITKGGVTVCFGHLGRHRTGVSSPPSPTRMSRFQFLFGGAVPKLSRLPGFPVISKDSSFIPFALELAPSTHR